MDTKISFHSFILAADSDAFLRNHEAFARIMGISHRVHRIHSPSIADREKLYYKYSKIEQVLFQSHPDEIHIFVDESCAFSKKFSFYNLLEDRDYWICQSGHEDFASADGALMILRARSETRRLMSRVTDYCRDIPTGHPFSRWTHKELKDLQAHPWRLTVEGIYPLLLFPSFGHTLPDIRAFALSFNPETHWNIQDPRSNALIADHMTAALLQDQPPFASSPAPEPYTYPSLRAEVRPSSLALVTAYTDNLESFARCAEENMSLYAERQGYTFFVYREARESISLNWRKTEYIARHLHDYDYVVWLDTDILFHRFDLPLHSLFGDNSLLIARAHTEYPFNSGVVGVRSTPGGFAFLHAVEQASASVTDKSGVYASGGDQSVFSQAWRDLGGQDVYPVRDALTLNTHPAHIDNDTFLVHYMGFPNNVRNIVMNHDAMRIRNSAL